MLAALLLAARQVVSLTHLIDCVWEDTPPATAGKQIRNTVSELRQRLGGASSIESVGDGYRLDPHDSELDSIKFMRHLDQARALLAEQLPARSTTEYVNALALWRGPALAGLRSSGLEPEVTRLNEQRVIAVEEWADLELAAGRHVEVAPELAAWTIEHPLRERLAAQFMLALYRAGRQGDAIAEYDRVQRTLARELGVAPAVEVRNLRQRILASDPSLLSTGPAVKSHARCSLPADVTYLVGRDDALRRILDLALQNDENTGGDATAVIISAIDGMAGIGKTTLAVHAAHRLSRRYPDAQLFVDLQGHSPDRQVVTAAAALDSLLRELGVPADQIPRDLDARASEWRAQLANRRVLVVLDNAYETSQLRPLLPGTRSSMLLITSRQRLIGLDSASSLTLEVLAPPAAAALFTDAVGDDRPNAEPQATNDIIGLCGHLPLAIRIAGARLRHRPTWTVAYLADRLRDQQYRLAELRTEDRSVAGAFEMSYRCLTAEQQRLFRLLGLLPGTDVDVYGAAALAGMDRRPAEDILEDLVDAHLLLQPEAGRYRFHDLVRAYAVDQLSNADRRAAPGRLLDYYVHSASAAMHVIAPQDRHRRPRLASTTISIRPPDDYQGAMGWLEIEYTNLLAAAQYAATHGWFRQAGELSGLLWRYFHIRDSHEDGLRIHTCALDAARVIGDLALEAHSLTYLGDNNWWLGRYDTAVEHHCAALSIARRIGNITATTRALHGLGIAHLRLGNYEAATGYLSEGLRLGRRVNDHNLVGFVLRALGEVGVRVGDHQQALSHLVQALELAQTTCDRNLEGRVLRGLGEIHLHLGDHQQAVTYLQQALNIGLDTSTRNIESRAVHGLGLAFLRLGRVDEALVNLDKALVIARETRNRALETEALNSLGEALRVGNMSHRALECYRQALALAEQAGDRYEQARAHDCLGHTHGDLGQVQQAAYHWRQALALYSDLGIPEADHIQSRLGARNITRGAGTAMTGARPRLPGHVQSPQVSSEQVPRQDRGADPENDAAERQGR